MTGQTGFSAACKTIRGRIQDSPLQCARPRLGVELDCLHTMPRLKYRIQGDTYQPNYGDSTAKILHIFRVLRDIGYERTVSSAHPWTSTQEGPFDYAVESAKTLRFLKDLREQVLSE